MTSPIGKDSRRSHSIALGMRLWRDYLSRYRGKLAIALVAMAAYAASAAAIPAGVEWINASLSGEKAAVNFVPTSVALVGPLFIILLGAINASAQYVQARLSASAALLALRDLQDDMFRKIVEIDDAEIRRLGQGQSIGRLTNGIVVLRETLTRALSAVRDLLTLLALCGVMIWYDWVLFAVVAALYALIGWPVARIGARLRKGSRLAQTQIAEIAAATGEAVSGARVIRAYSLQEVISKSMRDGFNRRLETLQKMARLRALNEPFIFFVGSLALAVVVAVVALRVAAGALNVPQFISFIIALLMLSQPARGLSTLNAVAQEGFGALEDMLALVDAEPSIVARPGAEMLNMIGGPVEFQGVQFSYDGERKAIDGLTFFAPAGQTTALVGESGSGKSTILNLLLRLYEPQRGAIIVNGKNISDVTLTSLRGAMAIVSQDGFLFNETIASNIGYGRQGATRGEIIEAARAAAAHDFIEKLPSGYETIVGEGGGDLSGGQRQRIAIARAFLKNAPILLLDEATSALDAESEHLIQGALSRLAKGRTTIVVAHRLSTIRNADLIVAIDKGRVVETGRHAELLARGGYYARVTRLQGVGVIVE